ncbi:MAG TPA: PhnD/SsuA/transferrin family substrate-binding protein [Nannocystaceae bacterium]|nr:PhnD/SsuA/transferrin family substrate-binding protein [Nannocystaceae bacterium]
MLASLPWYDLSEVRGALDRLWAAIARRLEASGISPVPHRLDRDPDYEAQWQGGELLLGQACGYDAVLGQADRLRVVATPHFEFPGCEGPHYCSFIVVRASCAARSISELRGLRCVINTPTSHSGMNVLRSLVAPLHVEGRFFAHVAQSGAHEHSLRMLRDDDADVAAIDCVTYGLLRKHRPTALAGTRVIHQTARVPAPPFVTSAQTPERVATALASALEHVVVERPDASIVDALGLRGISRLDISAYRPIAELAQVARAANYHEMSFEGC